MAESESDCPRATVPVNSVETVTPAPEAETVTLNPAPEAETVAPTPAPEAETVTPGPTPETIETVTPKAKRGKYIVRFEGNSSKRWDGKEIEVDGEWLASFCESSVIVPSTCLQLPWKGKGGEIVQWNVVVVGAKKSLGGTTEHAHHTHTHTHTHARAQCMNTQAPMHTLTLLFKQGKGPGKRKMTK